MASVRPFRVCPSTPTEAPGAGRRSPLVRLYWCGARDVLRGLLLRVGSPIRLRSGRLPCLRGGSGAGSVPARRAIRIRVRPGDAAKNHSTAASRGPCSPRVQRGSTAMGSRRASGR